MHSLSLIFLLLIFLIGYKASAIDIDPRVEKQYLEMGGSSHALQHSKCFLANYSQTSFSLREASLSERCNNMDGQNTRVDLNNLDHLVIVDYTEKSDQRRLFILDLENPQKPYVESYYVSHGRYLASHDNTQKALNKNTILEIDYFSNVKNSNASSSGFYITGHTYQGMWTGPQGDKFSLILHGISKDRNDNACDRAVVLHGNSYINETGANEGVNKMSSGCFMVDYNQVNQIISKIRGGGGDHFPQEDRLGGVLFFTYSHSEANLPANYFCTPASQSTLRL